MKLKLLLILLVLPFFGNGQEIKFPESFRGDSLLFKGMQIAEIPQEIKMKYGISENPGLINEPSKTKGLLKSGSIPDAKAVYLEAYEDVEENKMDCGFEIVQFASENELNKILPHLDKKWRDGAFLTVENYLIIVWCDGYKNFEERIDNMIVYFQKKVGARLYQDRQKDKKIK